MHSGRDAGREMGGRRGGTSSVQGRARLEAAGWVRAERTANMWPMSATPEMSQAEISASKSPKLKKSRRILVIAETSQVEMGPYVAVADVALALNSWAAIRSEDVSVNW